MISRKEAREITNNSKSSVNAILVKIDEAIRARANKGLSTASLGHIHEAFYESVPIGNNVTKSTLRSEVMDTLYKLGFSSTFGPSGAPVVPRGLQDEDGNGPLYITFNLVVSW